MGKTLTSLANFKVDPSVSISALKFVFPHEFSGDVGDLDANIFRLKHRRVQVEDLEVNGAEPSVFSGEDTVEEELDKLERGCVGANITGIAYSVAADGDAGAVGIVLFRTDLTDNHGVTDFLALVGWNVLVVDDEEGIGARYPLVGLGRSRTYALAKSPQFIGIRHIPLSFVTGVSTELAVFKELASSWIKYGQG